jgi:hypothetical protein
VLKDNTVGCWVVFVHFFFFISIYLYIFTISLGYDRGTSYLPRVSDRTSSRPLTSIDRTHGPLAFSRSIVASMGRSRLAHMGHTLAQGKRLRSQGNDYDPLALAVPATQTAGRLGVRRRSTEAMRTSDAPGRS